MYPNLLQSPNLMAAPNRVSTPSVADEGGGEPATYLTWGNWESEFQRAATENSVSLTTSAYNDFVEWVLFDASAFNLADGNAMETALTNETLSIEDLDTYAALYTP